MLIGIVGAPNKGKSLIFSTLTSLEVGVADYPFTTIEPNRGVCLLSVPCAHVSLGLPRCDARGGHCKEGMREIAVQLLDVAGLVPDAHTGKGMGNQFLDDLRTADGFIQVVDASGRTDLEGRPAQDFPLGMEIDFLQVEMEAWLAGVIARNAPKFKHRGLPELAGALSGLGYDAPTLGAACSALGLDTKQIGWSEEDMGRLARHLYAKGKPMVVAANKCDLPGARERVRAYAQMKEKAAGGSAESGAMGRGGGTETGGAGAERPIVPCSAAYEQALIKAGAAGLVRYRPGDESFGAVGDASPRQAEALAHMRKFMAENGGTGVRRALRTLVFERLGMMTVYPVEDENKYSDRTGQVLPDALLLPRGATAIDLARKVHTDLAASFIGAVDARTKRRIGRDHPLSDGDIVKIIAAR